MHVLIFLFALSTVIFAVPTGIRTSVGNATISVDASCNGRFSQSERDQITALHNSLRSKVANGQYVSNGWRMPTAANMMKMSYSCNLENEAQQWANNCQFQHSGASGEGENLYMSWSSNQLPIAGQGVAAEGSWENELQNPGLRSVYFNMNVFNTGVGHATQQIWHNTNSIGCGAASCDGGTSVIVVCRYQQPGNYLNSYIYTQGSTCSQCPSGTSCDSSNLCA